jgi:hypothetical protein
MCDGIPTPPTQQILPSRRSCVLDIHEDFLEVSNVTPELVLAHLYVRIRKPLVDARSSGTLVLQKSPALWISHMVLEGDGLVVRGLDVYEDTQLYIECATLNLAVIAPRSAI